MKLLRKIQELKFVIISIYLTLFTTILVGRISSLTDNEYSYENENFYQIFLANNDTSSPVIIFIKPDNNDTIIWQNNYDIIVTSLDFLIRQLLKNTIRLM